MVEFVLPMGEAVLHTLGNFSPLLFRSTAEEPEKDGTRVYCDLNTAASANSVRASDNPLLRPCLCWRLLYTHR